MADDWRSGARDLLVVVLTVTTGGVDAAAFLHLGHVFSSVITGTWSCWAWLPVPTTGRWPETAAWRWSAMWPAWRWGAPVVPAGGPLAGGLAGPPLPGGDRAARDLAAVAHRGVGLEFCVLAAFCVGWELSRGHPSGVGEQLLLASAGIAMGIQAATIRHLGYISTTYLTGTMMGVVSALVTGRKPDGLGLSLGIFAAVIAEACASALVTAYVPALLPVVLLVPLALVVWFASARFGPRPGWQDPE